jgi:predicted ATPase
LLGQGRTNKEIAKSLFVDVRTAEFHVANVLGKLGLETRAQVAAYIAHSRIEDAGAGAPYLPASLTSFVGREWEMATLRGLLQRSRLVTLTGPGGIGKTRLAIEAARTVQQASTEGSWFVDLAPLSNQDLVVGVMLSTMGFRQEPTQPGEETLLSALRDRKSFLLVDNCEHLLDRVSPIIQRIVRSCPGIRILATSRTPLGVDGEATLPLGGLQLPVESTRDPESGADSVHLFLDRAQLVRPAYEPTFAELRDIAALCRILEGMPLGIELAAARLSGMTPREIRVRVEQGQALLTTSSKAVPDRHKTIDAAIDWSYSLLAEPARAVFRRLSVCAGFDLEAAEATCTAPPIARNQVAETVLELVDDSLVVAQPTGVVTRYRLLEPVRQYAVRRLLEADEEAGTRRRHAEYFAGIAEHEVPVTAAPRPNWVEIIGAEQDNLRGALAWAGSHDADVELRLINALYRLWTLRGQLAELVPGVTHALSITRGPSRERQHMLAGLSDVRLLMGDAEAAIRLASESVALARHLGLRHEEYIAMNVLGNAQSAAHHPHAVATYERAADLARELGDPWRLGIILGNLGAELVWSGRWRRAHGLLNEALMLFRQAGNREGEQFVQTYQGILAFAEGDDAIAASCWFDALRIGVQLRDRQSLPWALDGLAQLSIKAGDHERGLRLAAAAAGIRAATGIFEQSNHLDLDSWLARARDALPKETADRAWMDGMHMAYEETLRYALEGAVEQLTAAPVALEPPVPPIHGVE